MEHQKFKFISRLCTATLASAFVLGMFPVLSTTTPVSAASLESTIGLPNLEDPAIAELIYLVEATEFMQYPFWNGEDFRELWDVDAARQDAIVTLANPNVSATQISAAYRHLQNEFDDYSGFFIQGKSGFEQFLKNEYIYITEFWGPITTPPYSPEQLSVLQVLDDAKAMAEGAGNSQKRYLEAYRYYRIEERRVLDGPLTFMNKEYYLSEIQDMRHTVAESLKVVEPLEVNVQQQVESFEKSIALWSALVQSDKFYNGTVYSTIRFNTVRQTRLFEQMRALADRIVTTTALLDSPRGIQPGQYPASAFGELNRAINNAKRKLETARTWEEVKNAVDILNGAADQFQASIKM